MFFFLTCVLSSLILPAACQEFDEGFSDGFHPDSLTMGLFVVLCIFAFLYGMLGLWNFVPLISGRGHRSPYALLLPTIFFSSASNAAYIAWIILENIPALNANDIFLTDLPVLLTPSLIFISNLFFNWAVILQFLVIITVLWNRDAALRAATDGNFSGHHPALNALHATLATLMFIFGTATESYRMATNVKYDNPNTYELEVFGQHSDYQHRILVAQQLSYVFNTFAVLTVVDVVATTVLPWRAWKKAGISDKITNLMLYVLVPLYSLFCLFLMIFTILFSPSGLSDSSGPTAFESADLADSILVTGTSIAILFFILALSLNKQSWNPTASSKQQQYWAPQPQYIYAAPSQVSQAGYYAGGPQQPMPYGQPQMYPAPDPAPMAQQGQYAQPHEYAPQP
ncbi:hypothetical protein B0H12DRAFT_603284 [Mycena haematopus]|nr:hypothetical protein B0H12DRAFT_603284 [Mycena haematopus]